MGKLTAVSSLWLAAAAASIDLHPPGNPRFGQQPWRDRELMPWRGRCTKCNPNASIQKAAKRARKITCQRRKS